MHKRVAIGKPALVLVAAIALAAISATVVLDQVQTSSVSSITIPSDSSIAGARNTTSSESSIYPSAGLQVLLDELSVTDNGTTGRWLNASLFNPFSTQLSLTPGPLTFGLGPCSQLPLGVALFRGYYTEANLSSAVPLNLYQPGTYNCEAIFHVTKWSFAPTSDNVTLVSQQPTGSGNATTLEDMWTQAAAVSIPLSGYWTGENGSAAFHHFSPGVYTAVAEDEWGDSQTTSFNMPSDSTGTNSSESAGQNTNSSVDTSDTFLTQCVVTGIGELEFRAIADSTGTLVSGENVTAIDALGCGIAGQPAETQIVYIDHFSVESGGWLTPVFPSQAEPGGQLSFTVIYQGVTYKFVEDIPPIGTLCVTLQVPSGDVTTTSVMNGSGSYCS